jgi:hypothetical protein
MTTQTFPIHIMADEPTWIHESTKWLLGVVASGAVLFSSAVTYLLAVIRTERKERVSPQSYAEQEARLKLEMSALEGRVLSAISNLKTELSGRDDSNELKRDSLEKHVLAPIQGELGKINERLTNIQSANLSAIQSAYDPLARRVESLEHSVNQLLLARTGRGD